VRYWNPRRAAARRIAEDTSAKFGREVVARAVGRVSGAVLPPGDTGHGAGVEDIGPEAQFLASRLAALRESNLGVFTLLVEELAKEGSVAGGARGP
jgi:hypothetical protein